MAARSILCFLLLLVAPLGAAAQTTLASQLYNASQATSGAFNDNRPQLYEGMAGWPSLDHYGSQGGYAYITWSKITIPTRSTLSHFTGNGASSQLNPYQFTNTHNFVLTIDGPYPDLAEIAEDPFSGDLLTDIPLTISAHESRGPGFLPSVTKNYNVELRPQTEVVLLPGVYFIGIKSVSPAMWFWSELNVDASNLQSALEWNTQFPSQSADEIRGQLAWGGGRTMQTGILAIDAWFSPLARRTGAISLVSCKSPC